MGLEIEWGFLTAAGEVGSGARREGSGRFSKHFRTLLQTRRNDGGVLTGACPWEKPYGGWAGSPHGPSSPAFFMGPSFLSAWGPWARLKRAVVHGPIYRKHRERRAAPPACSHTHWKHRAAQRARGAEDDGAQAWRGSGGRGAGGGSGAQDGAHHGGQQGSGPGPGARARASRARGGRLRPLRRAPALPRGRDHVAVAPLPHRRRRCKAPVLVQVLIGILLRSCCAAF